MTHKHLMVKAAAVVVLGGAAMFTAPRSASASARTAAAFDPLCVTGICVCVNEDEANCQEIESGWVPNPCPGGYVYGSCMDNACDGDEGPFSGAWVDCV
jgi:hypothetical protein